MKIPSSRLLLFTFSVLFLSLSVSCTTSNPVLDDFLQCLPKYSNSSYPISDQIITQESTKFQSVFLSYIRNLRLLTSTTTKPLAIVTANHETHVQATVICAKQNGLHMRIRSGGHDYEGLSFISYISNVSYIVLDMFNLRSININVEDESAWVESGAILGELYYNIAEKSKVHAFPGGVCPTVGVGGLFSGGGYGPMMRKFGLTVDNIEDARLVNVNGTILDRRSMGEDLFWAIRGGGGASFGVILSWKIKLLPIPPNVTVFTITRTLEQGAIDVLYRWQYVAPKLPKDIFIRATSQLHNSTGQVSKKTVEVVFNGLYLGQKESLLALVNHSFPELGLEQKYCIEMSWINATLFWAGYPAGTPTTVLLDRPKAPEILFKSRSDYVKEPIPKAALETIWQKILAMEMLQMQLNPYGGRMSEISESETPFPHRAGNLFKIQYYTLWANVTDTKKYLDLSSKFRKAMTPFVSKNPREAFQNYRDLDNGANWNNQTDTKTATVYGRKYFKNNFYRLVSVKTKVDPENFFRHEQSIPPLPHK
ncbi:berberine bridge enzyme-like 4 [Rosa rugosa]|uniref:berberine bridge enzyme-like 4 n=1 Tax=Rosa rugosa TaxID=74645 RepID=UPI002B402282|nr:berberine bridge enzyme-like 4 [Rosa rugosa]